MPPKPFIRFLLAGALAFSTAGCRKRAARSDATVSPAPMEAAATVDSSDNNTARNSAMTVNPQAKTSMSGQGVYGGTDLGKLERYKKWTMTLRDGSSAEKAAVRHGYQVLPPNEKKDFENYCRSCAINFP